MLRPDKIIDYFKVRAEKKQSDFTQLIDGINLGGRLVVGGGANNARKLQQVMGQSQRLGMIVSVAETHDLNPQLTYTFDTAAIAQMIMTSKNEAFHNTIDAMLNLLQKMCVDDGHNIEVGFQALREHADKIDRM